jgi:hypothetical protein
LKTFAHDRAKTVNLSVFVEIPKISLQQNERKFVVNVKIFALQQDKSAFVSQFQNFALRC